MCTPRLKSMTTFICPIDDRLYQGRLRTNMTSNAAALCHPHKIFRTPDDVGCHHLPRDKISPIGSCRHFDLEKDSTLLGGAIPLLYPRFPSPASGRFIHSPARKNGSHPRHNHHRLPGLRQNHPHPQPHPAATRQKPSLQTRPSQK